MPLRFSASRLTGLFLGLHQGAIPSTHPPHPIWWSRRVCPVHCHRHHSHTRPSNPSKSSCHRSALTLWNDPSERWMESVSPDGDHRLHGAQQWLLPCWSGSSASYQGTSDQARRRTLLSHTCFSNRSKAKGRRAISRPSHILLRTR